MFIYFIPVAALEVNATKSMEALGKSSSSSAGCSMKTSSSEKHWHTSYLNLK
jgi:hypothetical protein